jgi:hypothetical protein
MLIEEFKVIVAEINSVKATSGRGWEGGEDREQLFHVGRVSTSPIGAPACVTGHQGRSKRASSSSGAYHGRPFEAIVVAIDFHVREKVSKGSGQRGRP